jgi:hypothetical protein
VIDLIRKRRNNMWEDEMYSEIQKGDTVYFKDSSGSTGKGRAMIIGPAGWVVKSQYRGVPQVVQEDQNYLGHTPAKDREPDHFGEWLHGDT